MRKTVQIADRSRGLPHAREGKGAAPVAPAERIYRMERRAGWRRVATQVTESRLLPVAVIIATAFVLYVRALSGAFVHDDEKQIVENVFVTNPHLWPHIFAGSVWSFEGMAGFSNFYRPLMIFSFWLIDRLAGPVPFYYHLFQVMLFAAAAVMVYLIAKELVGSKPAALIAGLLWVMHPQKAEAVAWISAVCDTGCGLFYLIAFFLFLRGERYFQGAGHGEAGSQPYRRDWLSQAMGALALFIALLFKEMAVSFPLLLITYWLFHLGTGGWLRRTARLAPYVAAVAAYLAIRRAALGHLTTGGHLLRLNAKVVADATALLGGHTRLFFWPAHLSVFRDFAPESALRSPWPWVTLMVLVLAAMGRKRWPDFGFLVFWWPVTLLPCLDIRQLSLPLIADRMAYIPSVGLCVAFASLAAKALMARAPGKPTAWMKITGYGGLAAIMILWSTASTRAISHWHDNQTLTDSSLKSDPDVASLHIIRSWDLSYRKGDLAGAKKELEEAIRLNHKTYSPLALIDYQATVSLGQIALQEGHVDAAKSLFQQAIHIAPRQPDAYMSMGSIYLPRGRYAKASAFFQDAVKINPYDTSAKFLLGKCWMKLGKYDQAAQIFAAARQVDPDDQAAYQAEAEALKAEGKVRQATAVLALLARKKRRN